ncbi:MAG: 50S ribosomal protein L11 methyltransferase [Ruminococcaceae bacterium]|nr:50S ribosomal protein L11 methyltransferase [Oscillospiraceae bacterium]
MNWIKTVIYTTKEGIEPVCGQLLNVGINGTQIEDEDDFNDFLENNKAYWDLVDDDLIESKKGESKVIFYLAENEYLPENLANVKNAMNFLSDFDTEKNFGRLNIETSVTNEEDWANNWKKYFKPINIGDKITVCPVWENVDEKDRTVFKINPGMSFGTGTHHSTRMCIEYLQKIIKEGDEILDIGCGSGILSIISLMLGAKSAVALDIDPNCEHIAYENAALNGIFEDKYTVYSGNILSDKNLVEKISQKKYDVVEANIIADVIIALAPLAANLVKKGGTFLCSGIILNRSDEVEEALKKYFKIQKVMQSGEWISIACTL